MTIAVSVTLVLIWRLCGVWVKCDRAAYRWKWWKVKASWGLLCFDLVACTIFYLMAKTTGTLVGKSFTPARETLTQLMISGAAATGVRGLRMPSALKRRREPSPPAVERETVNQYFERCIQQNCYSESQLWIMEKVVPHVLDRHGVDKFLDEAREYLEGHDGAHAATDAKWIEKVIRSGESDKRKVASACGRMLTRNGFGYLERVLARSPDEDGQFAPEVAEKPLDLPDRHPAASTGPFVPRPDPASLFGRTGPEQGDELT